MSDTSANSACARERERRLVPFLSLLLFLLLILLFFPSLYDCDGRFILAVQWKTVSEPQNVGECFILPAVPHPVLKRHVH